MDKRVEIAILLDIYGVLLTEKQRDIMDIYFNDDLSLGEISENNNTSRQAIHDTIKRCEKLLFEYEEKLHLMNKNFANERLKTKISDNIDKVLSSKDACQDSIDKILLEIKKDISDLN